MTSIRMLTVVGGLTLLCTGIWPSTFASAQVVERGVQGAAVGAIIGGIVGGGRGAGTGAAIGAGVGVLSGAAEANARAQGYYGPPPPPVAGVGVSIGIAPPLLPVYEQPLCPGPGYIWTPGYWAYGQDDYYWVPGTWVLPPIVGLLWTPGYWGYDGGVYAWHAGYWGPHVGYYGGINYGFGYGGVGYEGGYWNHGAFFYNTAVTRVNTTVITNTYNKTIIKNEAVNNVSFNGGPGGTRAQPTAQELAWSREQHTPPTALQQHHQQSASADRALFASVNHGTPTVAATVKPGAFAGPETVGPKGLHGTNKMATGAPSQTSLDRAEHHTDHEAFPHAPGGPGGPFASREPGGTHNPGSPGGPFAKGGSGPYGGPHGPGPRGPGGPGGPGPYGGPHGPGGPHGGAPVAQGGPGSHGKPNQHDQGKSNQHDQER